VIATSIQLVVRNPCFAGGRRGPVPAATQQP